MMNRTQWLISAGACAVAALATAAHGQAVEQAAQPSDSQAAPADQAVGEIVVTAQKSSEKLSKAPIAVSVVAQGLLDRQGLTTGEQLATTVPSLKLSQNGFAIRGIGSNNSFSGYSTVATQFDGIYNPSSAALSMAVFDIASVEVARGPQGTVYGRNATAGVVNINTADPGKLYGGSASVQYGRFNDIRAQAAVDLPVSDTLGLRVAAFRQVNDGYGPQFKADRFDRADLAAVRVTTKWQPTSSFSWRLSGSYGENHSTVPAVYLRNYTYYPQANLTTGTFGPGTIVQSDAINPGLDLVTANRQSIKSYDLRSKVVWQISAPLTVTWLAGYSLLKNDGVVAASGVFSQEYLGQRTRTWSNEVDVNYESGPLKLVAGAYLYEDKQPSGQRLLHAGNTAPAPFNTVFNAFGPIVAGTGNQISTIAGVDVVNTYSGTGSRSHALFGQATLKPLPGLRLTAGVRSTWDSVFSREQQLVCAGNTVTRATVSADTCPVGGTLAYTDDRNRAAVDFSKVNWKLGVDADLTHDVVGYVTVSTGYRGGGLQASTNPAGFRQYAPETVTNYEAGLRGNFWGNRLFVGLTAYQMDYRDLQVSTIIVDPVQGPIAVTTNAAKARIRGLELETTFRPTSADRLSGYVSLMDARFRSFADTPDGLLYADTMYNIFAPLLGYASITAATTDNSGKRLAFAPKFSARASYSHAFTLASGARITPAVDFFAQSMSYATAQNIAQGRIAGYTKTDLNLQFDDASGHAYVNLFINNVEDRRIPTTVVPVWSSTTASYAPPRTYGVRVGFKY
ncbi:MULTISPECIES: TonB-dependent receptor [unclassified Novosphingobium]|uniref:TonB-dependent receptor n=2 Tax=Novosphingobium TaxID=165696 RepID=UPI00146E0FE2|nr:MULTISPECIES: TonB-dependent receptor [unclassified Novosphingobium]NMN05434.1 iron complex outermembrane receptor protein [Novosphingobium sp. SG919]NMN87729.1 iron complex outermembrane receptor protein [Novosphingobium sp. SG916]